MEQFIPYLRYVGKAAFAGAFAFCGSAATGSLDGHLTQPDVWTAAGFAVAAAGAVFGFKNGPKPTR